MSNQNNQPHFGKFATAALTAIASLTAGFSGIAANAQEQTQAPVLMAPPISLPPGTFDADSDGDAADTAPPAAAPTPPVDQNVFQWQDVPANRQVPITRAVFDKGGYRLTDDQGETIVVPFANQNLYVLRFGQTTGGMYFVNDGTTPTLYIPVNGYLENASAQGARWYPFPQNYTYSAPVYVGPAPSWSEWVGMGWYPDMVYYGGYYGYEPWSFGVAFDAFPGLYFSIGGRPYYGWNAYHTYYSYHPNNRFYVRDGARFGGYGAGRRGSNEFGSRPSHFGGAIRTGGFGGGASGGYAGSAAGASGHAFSGGQRGGNSSFPSNPPRTFRGGQGGSQSSQGGHGGATFGGDHASGGQFSGGHTSSGGFGGNFGGGGGHSSSGTESHGGDRGFSGGSGNSGGGRGFGGSMGGGGGSHMGGMSGGGGHFGGGGGGHR